MPIFKNKQHLYDCIGGFFKKTSLNKVIGPNIKGCGLVIKYQFTNPDAEITIDTQDPGEGGAYFGVYCDHTDLKPDVIVAMEADIGHRYCAGSLDLITALTRRQIIARGPVYKIMRMLPSVKPAHIIYRRHLQDMDSHNLRQQMA